MNVSQSRFGWAAVGSVATHGAVLAILFSGADPATPEPRAALSWVSHAEALPAVPMMPMSDEAPEPALPNGEGVDQVPVLATAEEASEGAPESHDTVAILAEPAEDALSRYAGEIADLLARHRRYPLSALLRGEQGRVVLRLRFAPSPALTEILLERSSGVTALDEGARDMVHAASPLPPPPAVTHGREFHLLVPVTFEREMSASVTP